MNDTIPNTTWRRSVSRLLLALLCGALLAVSIGAPSALAERPVELEVTQVFPDINPCTSEPMLVTIHLSIREQIKDNGNVVVHVSRTGSTDDGYVMDHGVESFVFNGNVVRAALTDTWRSDDGSHFKAQGVFVATEDGPLVDRFRLRCVRP